MAIYPGAIVKLLPTSAVPHTLIAAYNRVNLHVAVSEADSLFGYFASPGAKPSAHFYVRRDGTVEQYVDTLYRAEADLEGNDATISIETQGGVTNANGEPWTSQQLTAIAQVYAWAISVHHIRAQIAVDAVAHSDTSLGLSVHRLGIDPWRKPNAMHYSTSAGKVCPGDAKISQVPTVYMLATGAPGVTPVQTPPAPVAPAPTVPAPKNWVKQGDTGSLVTELQTRLNAAGWHLNVDGIFGPLTETAVKEYQGSRGLVIDGIAGDQTFTALRTGRPAVHVPPPVSPGGPRNLARGAAGADVKALQHALNVGYPLYSHLTEDGVFGPATDAVVREFQRRAGLTVDGIVGPQTRAALHL